MAKKFTGGDYLNQKDGLAFYIHKLMMLNELKGGYGAYQISNAVNANSGLSFGGNQKDISSKQNQAIFEKILHKATDIHGNRFINQDEVKQIQQHLYKSCREFTLEDKQIYQKLKNKINQALSSTEGITIINADYTEELYIKNNHLKNAILNIQDENVKEYISNSISAKLIIVDTYNQFGSIDKKGYSVPNQLLKILDNPQDNNIDIPFSNRSFKIDGMPDIQDIINFKLSTNYGQKYPKDTMRRIYNIQDIVNKYASKDNLIENINVINPEIDGDLKQKDIDKLNIAKHLETSINNLPNKKNYIIHSKAQEIIENKQSQRQFDDFKHVLKVILPDVNKNTVHITSKFGYRKINHKDNYHGGIDFNYVGGQSGINLKHPHVYSPVSGIVTVATGKSGYGTVKIKDKDGISHEILHLDSQSVKAGQKIEEGNLIGTMGGRVPKGKEVEQHVHYQIKDEKGKVINPIVWWNSKIELNYTNLYQNKSLESKLPQNQSNQSNSNIWYPTPINISNTDERYKNIENNIKKLVPEFLDLIVTNQEKMVREYINAKNQQYAQNIKEAFSLNLENTPVLQDNGLKV